ncbi:MAG: endonuclease NucS, partial [Candidatus Bathyarchaeia archaeon]
MEEPRHQIVLENPSLEEAYRALKRGLARRRTIIVAGNCSVNYEGRASSKLEPGERMIVF